jgi:hypothetical protein
MVPLGGRRGIYYAQPDEAFNLTPNEVASLERSVPGQALVLCAGQRVFLDVEASPDEKELFDTRPSEPADVGSIPKDTSWHLFDDLEPDEGAPIPLPTWRRRS